MPKQPFQIFAAQEFQATGTLPTEIELLQVGDWQAPWKGHIVNTVDDFHEMIANFEGGAGKFQPDNKLPINLDHMKIEAAGWIHGLEVRGDSLWGTGIEWTPLGKQKLADKEFAYLSSEWSPVWQNPLNEEEFVNNVFEGAALTNYPLYSTLEPLVANRKQKKVLTTDPNKIKLYMKGSVMNLSELLSKEASELTAEEKAFIVENRADLSDEQVTTLTEAGVLEADTDEGGEGDGSGAGDGEGEGSGDEDGDGEGSGEGEGGEGGDGQSASKKTVSITASQFAELKASAAKGVEAANKLRDNEATAKALSMTISASNKDGRFLEASAKDLKSFVLSLSASQEKAFTKLVASLPKIKLADRQSHADTGEGAGAVAELDTKAKAKMEASRKEGKPLSFMQASKQIQREDSDLAERVKQEQEEN